MKRYHQWRLALRKFRRELTFSRIITWLVISGIAFFTLFLLASWILIADSPIPLALSPVEFKHIEEDVTLERGSLVEGLALREFNLHMTSPLILDEELVGRVDSRMSELYLKEDLEFTSILQNECTEIYCLQYRTPFYSVPSTIWRALIGVEDRRYLKHRGVDLRSILRALIVDLKEMKLVQGGSTLTQQLIKNLFLTNEKTLSRKLKEMIFAIYIEWKYTKEEILSAYLNETFWGSFQGVKIKGVKAASILYLGKNLDELDDFEGTILIALLKGPSYYHPVRKTDRLRERAEGIYKELQKQNLVNSETKAWSGKEWRAWSEKLKERNNKKFGLSLWLASRMDREKLNFYEAYTLIHKAKFLETELKKRLGKVDLAIKALVGDPFCAKESCPRLSYYSKIERNKKKAIKEERHQVGSLMKPITYNLLTKMGKSWGDLVSTHPFTLKLKSGKWRPRDSGRRKKDKIELREALRRSRNIPLIRTANEVGFSLLEDHLKTFIPQLKLPLEEYPAQLLGAVEMSVEEVFEMYGNLFSEECTAAKAGKKDWEDNSVIGILSDPSQTTIQYRVDKRLKNFRFFGKTGTTNQARDNWFAGFDGELLYIFWVGVESKKNEKDLKLSGSSTAFRLFQEFTLYRGVRFGEIHCETRP